MMTSLDVSSGPDPTWRILFLHSRIIINLSKILNRLSSLRFLYQPPELWILFYVFCLRRVYFVFYFLTIFFSVISPYWSDHVVELRVSRAIMISVSITRSREIWNMSTYVNDKEDDDDNRYSLKKFWWMWRVELKHDRLSSVKRDEKIYANTENRVARWL